MLATDSLEPSGLGEHMIVLGQSLVHQYDIVIACQNDENGIAFLARAAKAGLRIIAFSLDDLPGFGRWLKAAGAAFLHVHAGIGWEGHELVRLGKAAGLPVLRTEHLPYLLTSPVQQAEYAAMLLSVDRVIGVSQGVAESYAARPNTARMKMIANGIATPSCGNRQAVRSELGLRDDAPLLLTVARFTQQKDHASLVAAVPQVLLQHPDARFVFVGDGPEQDRIEQMVREQGLEQSVTFLGRRFDVPDLLAAADIFVLPSLFEGLPLVLLEAMAVGLPIVATAIDGTVEAIGKDHPFLVTPGDPMLLASIIGIALGDREAAKAAGDAGKTRFIHQFQADRMAMQTAALYAGFLAGPSHTLQARNS
ncbi:MAG: hypothetical protein JWQ22_448 [Devosia sp.]|nr:hypothetical protein [Devosia sp.]